MNEHTGEFKKQKGGVGVYALVVVQAEFGAKHPGVNIECDGRGFTSQGYVEQVPNVGYETWKAGAVAGVNFALEVSGRDDVMVTITKIEGLTTDTNPSGVAAAAADAVWKALEFTPHAGTAAYVEKMAMSGWSLGSEVVPTLHVPGDDELVDPDLVAARDLLLGHAGYLDHPRLQDGFIAILRPYEGELKDENFLEVIESLLLLGDHLHAARRVDSKLAAALWDMCVTARRYGVHPRGMLKRNKLITNEDATRLETWIATIESICTRLFYGKGGLPDVFFPVIELVNNDKMSHPRQGWAEFLGRAVLSPDFDVRATAGNALTKLGVNGSPALAAVKQQLEREDNDEVRAALEAALLAMTKK